MPGHRGFVVMVAAVLAGCTSPGPIVADRSPLVWPEQMEERPRVEFVRAFTRPEDVEIQKGLLQQLGEFLFGRTDARLVRPMAVVASGEVLYVADPGAKGVHRFDPKAGRYDLLLAEGEQPMPSPVGLALGGEGEVYVTDSSLARVFVIRSEAKAAVALPLPALERPTGVAFDAEAGRLFVTDTAAHQIKVFDRKGTLLSSLGSRGSADGEFNFPTQLWRDKEGALYVTDSLNYRVQVFDREGRFLRQFGKAGDGAGDFMRHKGVATDSFGHVYLVDGVAGMLLIYDGKGQLLLSIGGLGQHRGEFWLPSGLFIDAADRIYVADTYNGRVQVFRYIGGPT